VGLSAESPGGFAGCVRGASAGNPLFSRVSWGVYSGCPIDLPWGLSAAVRWMVPLCGTITTAHFTTELISIAQVTTANLPIAHLISAQVTSLSQRTPS
jgi:hypothetical protein